MPKLLCKNNLVLIICFFTAIGKGQTIYYYDDLSLLASKQFTNNTYEKKRTVTYLFANKNALVKYNPVSMLFGGLLFFYQKTISVQIGAACPYEVNCSNFSKKCIQKYGLLKGIPLTADRLTRCTKLAMIGMVDGVDYNSKRMIIYDDPNNYNSTSK